VRERERGGVQSERSVLASADNDGTVRCGTQPLVNPSATPPRQQRLPTRSVGWRSVRTVRSWPSADGDGLCGVEPTSGRWLGSTTAQSHRHRRCQDLTVRTGRHPDRVREAVCWREGVADGLTSGWVPQPHRPIVVGAGQKPDVRTERHPVHASSRPMSAGKGLPMVDRWWVPHRTVPSLLALGQSSTVGAEPTP